MATKEEKITALTKLMTEGILSADEFTRVVAALEGTSVAEPAKEKTPAEMAYESYITDVVARCFKSPSSVKFPPFDPSMVKEGVIELDAKQVTERYTETYVDAPNSYGAMLREEIIIGINDNFEPQYWAQHITRPFIGGKSKGWYKVK